MLSPHPHLQCRGLKKGRAIPLPTLRALVAYKGGNLYLLFVLKQRRAQTIRAFVRKKLNLTFTLLAHYLFICNVFKDATSISNCASVLMNNETGCERKRSWLSSITMLEFSWNLHNHEYLEAGQSVFWQKSETFTSQKFKV